LCQRSGNEKCGEDWEEKKMQAKSLFGIARISAGILFTSAESHHLLSSVPNA
jgi:hypothetical protein